MSHPEMGKAILLLTAGFANPAKREGKVVPTGAGLARLQAACFFCY